MTLFYFYFIKATQMGTVNVTYFRLTNCSFCLIWARMNFFQARLMVFTKKVDSKVLRMAIFVTIFCDKTIKHVSKWFILAQITQNLEFINFKHVSCTQIIWVSLNQIAFGKLVIRSYCIWQ